MQALGRLVWDVAEPLGRVFDRLASCVADPHCPLALIQHNRDGRHCRKDRGARTAAWLRGSCRVERVAAGRGVRLAKALAAEHECMGRALSDGRASEEQARVIVRTRRRLTPRGSRP